MGMLKEFKEFAMRGNVIDLAVGIVIGVAFTGIITSLVNDIIMPVVGIITGGYDFKLLSIRLRGDAVLMYGNFIQAVVNFVLIAFALFMVVKLINSMRKKEEATAPPPPSKSEILLEEIRDLLKKQ